MNARVSVCALRGVCASRAHAVHVCLPVGAHVHAYVLVSMPPVQMEPQCSWSQCREKKGRPGEGKGCGLLGSYLQTQTPQRPLDPAQGCPGPWGSEGCAEASEALGWTDRRTACSQHVVCRTPSQQPTSEPPGAHVGRVNTRSRVAPRPGHRRGQLGVSSGHVASWLRDLGQCWQWGCAAFPGFLQGRDETPSKSQCPRAGPAGPAPRLLCSSRVPASHRPHRCVLTPACIFTLAHCRSPPPKTGHPASGRKADRVGPAATLAWSPGTTAFSQVPELQGRSQQCRCGPRPRAAGPFDGPSVIWNHPLCLPSDLPDWLKSELPLLEVLSNKMQTGVMQTRNSLRTVRRREEPDVRRASQGDS